jgi:hypothetical protein
MNELDEIFGNLEYINQQKRVVSLVNTYQGVSISLDVEIIQVTRRRGEITVTTRHGQNISLLPASKILIHSDLFPKPIEAKVGSVDVHHRTGVLKNLRYPKSMRDGRKELRIQPQDEVKVRVTYRNQNEIIATVADLSVEGISLLVSEENQNIKSILAPKDSVRLSFRLPVSGPIGPYELSFPSTVTYVNPVGQEDDFRVGFMTFPDEQEKSVLRRFIFDMQTQIFNEIQQPIDKKDTSLFS